MLEGGGEQLVSAIAGFNELIASHLDEFTTANTGVTAKLVDTHVPFNTALDDPAEYGAPDATCYNEDGVSCVSPNPTWPSKRNSSRWPLTDLRL